MSADEDIGRVIGRAVLFGVIAVCAVVVLAVECYRHVTWR